MNCRRLNLGRVRLRPFVQTLPDVPFVRARRPHFRNPAPGAADWWGDDTDEELRDELIGLRDRGRRAVRRHRLEAHEEATPMYPSVASTSRCPRRSSTAGYGPRRSAMIVDALHRRAAITASRSIPTSTTPRRSAPTRRSASNPSVSRAKHEQLSATAHGRTACLWTCSPRTSIGFAHRLSRFRDLELHDHQVTTLEQRPARRHGALPKTSARSPFQSWSASDRAMKTLRSGRSLALPGAPALQGHRQVLLELRSTSSSTRSVPRSTLPPTRKSRRSTRASSIVTSRMHST